MRRALVTLAELNRLSAALRKGPPNFALRSLESQILEYIPRNHGSPMLLSRNISVKSPCCAKETSAEEVTGEEDPAAEARVNATEIPRDLDRDRTKVIPVETSMRYLESNAYKETYGDNPVWVLYRRNFKGQFAPKETRRTCIRGGQLVTRNPCPVCRDEYLVLDYRNTKLLQQFISPFNGEVLHWDKTGLCRMKQMDLHVAIEKAKDYGTITFDLPVRQYNYDDYYGNNPRNYY